jgi:hypothetical protein
MAVRPRDPAAISGREGSTPADCTGPYSLLQQELVGRAGIRAEQARLAKARSTNELAQLDSFNKQVQK